MKCEVCSKDFETTRATMCHIAAVHPTWLAERLALEEPDVQTEPDVKLEVPKKKGFFEGFFDGPWTVFDLFEQMDAEKAAADDDDGKAKKPGFFAGTFLEDVFG
ncbi:unnamed protein product [marine sediment metagenome]|uniref:C2H2-type domain-containing protein n=1 Tax=marine sediment metagenome TaxID=412755 RepID=X1VBW6_9ZZZZ